MEKLGNFADVVTKVQKVAIYTILTLISPVSNCMELIGLFISLYIIVFSFNRVAIAVTTLMVYFKEIQDN